MTSQHSTAPKKMTTQTTTEAEGLDFKKILREGPTIKETQAMVKGIFDTWISEGQAKAIQKIVFNETDVAFSMPTQYGKTVAIGTGLALYLYINTALDRTRSIAILSNKDSNCDKIRNKMMDAVGNCPSLIKQFTENPANDVERLKQEVSKSHIKLSNGCEVIMQAAGPNVTEENLDGDGAHLIIVDESDNVPEDNFTKGVRRMKGASVHSRIVQSGNCTLRNKHFMEAMEQEESYDSFRIPWTEAVNHSYGPNGEQCMTREFVMGEKSNLPPSHFKAMYLCEFPDEAQSGLISYSYLNKAKENEWKEEYEVEDPVVLYSQDVAREGRDRNVQFRVEKHNGRFKVTDKWSWDEPDTNVTARKAVENMIANNDISFDTSSRSREEIIKKLNSVENPQKFGDIFRQYYDSEQDSYTRINVDSHGIGAGVLDTLRNWGIYAVGVKVGVSGRKNLKRPDDFQDLKAEFYDKVRKVFEAEDIVFECDHSTLVKELNSLETEKNTRNKIRVVDPSKSPDHADSLMLALSVDKPRKTSDTGSAKVY